MRVFRWFLSHLTLFLIIATLLYVLFNVLKSSGIEENTEAKLALKNSHLKKNTELIHSLNDLSGNKVVLKTPSKIAQNKKLDSEIIEIQTIAKKENTNTLNTGAEIENETIIVSESAQNQAEKQVIATQLDIQFPQLKAKKNNKNIPFVKIHSDQKASKNESMQQSIDDMVSLLMSSNHMFNNEVLETKEKENQIETKWSLAKNYFNNKNYELAEQEYLDLIKLEPEFSHFYDELSQLYFVQNEINKYNTTLVTLARLYIRNKDIKEANHVIHLIAKTSLQLANQLRQELSNKLMSNKTRFNKLNLQ